MSSFAKNLSYCFTIVVYVYGVWYALSAVLMGFSPTMILPPIAMIGALYALRMPRPPEADLETIIGKDFLDEENGAKVMRSVAHRGAGLDAPENSLVAFRRCKEKKCMFIEFDITLTKDGVAVIFHDETLERIASDKRKISDCLYSELQEVDISVNHPFCTRYTGTKIPTLDETIRLLLNTNQKMFIDMKDYDRRMVNVVIDVFKKYPELHKQAIVTTFFPHLIYEVRWKNPKIVCAMATRPFFFNYKTYNTVRGVSDRRASSWYMHKLLGFVNSVHTWALPRFTYYFLGISVILLHKDIASPLAISDWRRKGVRPIVWSVNQPLEKQYCSKVLKCPYLTDTLDGESNVHLSSK